MIQLQREDLDRIQELENRCKQFLANGMYYSPNLGYVIHQGSDESQVRSAYADAYLAATEVGMKYGITNEILWRELKPANHPFFDFVLTMNHLGYAMKLAHIPLVPRG